MMSNTEGIKKDEFEADSSFIEKVRYNYDTKEMVIWIKGNTNSYACQEVPAEVYEQFKRAGSKGKYFNKFVKGKYEHEWFKRETI